MSVSTSYRLTPQDTWFFRESRPMESPGGSELNSVFPPPPRTVLGALRTAMGDAWGIHWPDFHPDHPLTDIIGFGNGLGPLALNTLHICLHGERLYPAPLALLQSPETGQLQRLSIGQAITSSLGFVRLPQLKKHQRGYKPLTEQWLRESALRAFLQGDTPNPDDLVSHHQLFKPEARLGIARNNQRRTAEDGGLYQTRHLRLQDGVTLEVGLTQAENSPVPSAFARLGGEGRMAHIQIIDSEAVLPPAPSLTRPASGAIVTLLSPGRFVDSAGQSSWLPATDFTPHPHPDGHQIWRGQLAGQHVDIHCALLDKAHREGGWDLARSKPRDVHSLIPAGSCYYLTPTDPDQPLEALIKDLHGQRIGTDTQLGRGLVACALWPDTENQ